MKNFTLKAIIYVSLSFVGVRTQAQDVLTQHNDLNRTGWNPNETILTQSNVTPTSFGLLYKKMVDDQIYAQPLYVGGVSIGGVSHNIVYVATVNNSVYAFDTDDGTLDPYWQKNLTMAGKTVPVASDIHSQYCPGTNGYGDFKGNAGQTSGFGIVGTPVIDKGRNVIYLVSRSRDLTVDNGSHTNDQDWSSAGFYQQFHALSLSTGNDTLNSPVNFDNSVAVPGTGDGKDGSNLIHFDPRRENQRVGLVLYNNVVYVTYAAHCDMDFYHGWIIGLDAGNLSIVNTYITTPNDGRGGIWMSGAAPAVDAAGNFYFAAGNAKPNSAGVSQDNMGLRIVRAKPAGGTFTNLSWFKPMSYTVWNNGDLDFGTGLVLIPSANMLVTAHKSGNLVLLRENPTVTGEFNESDAANFLGYVNIGAGNESHSAISYYGGTANQYVYQFSENTNVRAYPVNVALPGLGTPIINSSVPVNSGVFHGGFLSGSSNGSADATAILWVSHETASGGAIHALKANDITKELWNSDALPVDNLGKYAKMNSPTIANGKVFAPTFSNSLNVYGLLATNIRCVTNVALNKPATGSPNTDGANPASNATDGNTGTRWGIVGPSPTYIYVDLQSRFDICKIDIHWDLPNDYPINYNIDISDDAITWTNIESVVNSVYPPSNLSSFNENSTARYVRIFVQPGSMFFTSVTEFQVYGSPANSCISPTGLTANPTQNSAVLSWAPVAGATQYIVKYISNSVQSYVTRTVPNTGNPVTLNISALTCGFGYTYQVQTDCGSGSLSNPSSLSFSTDNCSSPCSNFQHFGHGDLGDIQVAGMSCFDGANSTFIVTGAGNGLGGNGDQFQFEFKQITVDGDPVVHIVSQDQIAPSNSNLAGLMLRDSVTDISRFMFVGKTGDNSKIYMIYRTSPGGTAQSMFIARPAGADYFRILKSGNTFSAYYGTAITGPWVQVGANQTIPFVGTDWYEGMAVSSLNATVTSTAVFDNFNDLSTPLPITLLSFTANNVNDTYVSLNWQTSMELNNDHFDIERSVDAVHFSRILSVKSQGNSDTLQKYTAVDNAPARGLNFYRLKQVDIDGRFGYSIVQQVKFGVGTGPVVYPNPISSLFKAIPGSEPIEEIVIYNVQGRAVQYAKSNSPADEMTVNISPLSAGIYILKIKTDSKIYQVKIVKE
jgi:F5/8 type C domain/Secretion system C-terminal sorting domain